MAYIVDETNLADKFDAPDRSKAEMTVTSNVDVGRGGRTNTPFAKEYGDGLDSRQSSVRLICNTTRTLATVL